MIKVRALKQVELSLNDVFKLALKLKIPRQVIYSETDTEKYIVIFGMHRINQNKSTLLISTETYKLLSLDSGRWVKNVDNSFLKFIPILYTGSVNVFESLFKDALDLLLSEVIGLGYVIMGWMNIGVYQAINYSSEKPEYIEHKHAYFYSKVVSRTKEKTSFIYGRNGLEIDEAYLSNKDKLNINEIKKLQLSDYSIACAENDSINVAFWSRFQFVRDFYVGLKSLNLAVRKFLNKDLFSLFLKVNCNSLCYHGHSAFDKNLFDYIEFVGKFNIKNDIGGASPLLRLINPKNGKVCIIDGSNSQLMRLAKLEKYISRNDIKFLRKSNSTLSFFLALEIDEKLKFSRRNTSKLKSKEYFSTIMVVMKNIFFTKLPVVLRYRILNIFEKNCTRWVRDFHQSDFLGLERVITKWLEYHKELYKNIKYRNSMERWDTEMNYLDHALEWVIIVKPLIHKNQTWESFHKLAVAWNLEINNRNYKSYPTEWKPINIIPQKISNSYQIIEITNSEGLHKEGAEMEHCVYTYCNLCASGRYRVFSIFNEEERATLGLSVKKGSDKYILDQVRGTSNMAVSTKLKKLSKDILNSVNVLCA